MEIINELPEKLYSGAIVTYPQNNKQGSAGLMKKILRGISAIHKSLEVIKEFRKPDDELSSYDVAHHAGLSIEDEYVLLELLARIAAAGILKKAPCQSTSGDGGNGPFKRKNKTERAF